MKPAPWILSMLAAFALATAAQTPVDQTKPFKADGRISIENVSGSVSVTGWDRAEIQVKGTLGRSTEPLVFEISDGTARIEVHPKKNARGEGSGTLVIQVPKQSRVEVDSVSADVRARDLAGAVDLHSVSGNLDASGISGDVGLETVSGDVKAETSSRSLRCASVSGAIQVAGKFPSRVEMESVSGSITYDGGLAKGGEMKGETVSGTIEVRVPAATSADFEASSFSGSITSDLPAPLNLKKEGPVGKTASFRVGSGDGKVKVESFSGSIRFVKK